MSSSVDAAQAGERRRRRPASAMPNSEPCRAGDTTVRGHVFDVRAGQRDAVKARADSQRAGGDRRPRRSAARRLRRAPRPGRPPAPSSATSCFVAEGVTAIDRLLDVGPPRPLGARHAAGARPPRRRLDDARRAGVRRPARRAGGDRRLRPPPRRGRRRRPAAAAVARRRRRRRPTLAVLEGLNDPENLGAIARSARAFGIDGARARPDVHRPVLPAHDPRQHGRGAVPARRPGGDVARRPRALRRAGFETWALTPDGDAEPIWSLAVPARVACCSAPRARAVSGGDAPRPTAGCASRSPPASTRSTSATPPLWRSPTSVALVAGSPAPGRNVASSAASAGLHLLHRRGHRLGRALVGHDLAHHGPAGAAHQLGLVVVEVLLRRPDVAGRQPLISGIT